MNVPGYVPRRLIRRVDFRPPTPFTMATHGLASLVLIPAYAAAAVAIGTPGMRFHREAVAVAARLALKGGPRLRLQAGRLAIYPMDSTRYFEFDWAWSALMRLGRVSAYLDMSSPRLFPLCYARRSDVQRAVLLNPDAADLDRRPRRGHRRWAWRASAGSPGACGAASTAGDGRFDAITSISVFEHIADEREALTALRRVLKPGGTAAADIAVRGRGV